MSGWRNISVDGHDYRWRCSKGGLVEVRSGRDVVVRSDSLAILGVHSEEWHRAIWKGGGYSITPADIAKLIRSASTVSTALPPAPSSSSNQTRSPR